uniref:Uncharacterized protein n=1 Tax=Romanomermis culicivorax TaxID=13658 RepID=A0A915IAK9_ROMCU
MITLKHIEFVRQGLKGILERANSKLKRNLVAMCKQMYICDFLGDGFSATENSMDAVTSDNRLSSSMKTTTRENSCPIERFDFIFNHYFATHATFDQFDPFENGYIMGFMLAILCSIANSGPPSPGSRYVGIEVDDILVSVLGIKDGFKSLTITKERMSEVHDRGLNKKDRENIAPGLIEDGSEQKIVNYLLYDINNNVNRDKKCGHRIPYMQRITKANRSNENAQRQASGNIGPAISLIFQTKTSLRTIHAQDIQPLIFDLTEQSAIVKKPDKNIIKVILTMAMKLRMDENTTKMIKVYVTDQSYAIHQAASGVIIPLFSAGLAIYDIHAAVENYENGDQSAIAIYGIASSVVFLVTSLMSLGVSIVMFAKGAAAVSPMLSVAIFIVGTAFYIAGHIWKGYTELERISNQISMSGWEKTRQYTRLVSGYGIFEEFIRTSNDKEWNMQRLKDGIKYMEANSEIRSAILKAQN